MGNQGGTMKRNDANTFVPAVEPTAAPARPAPTVELVSGKVLDNLWGGVGVAVALSAIYALARIALANLGMMPLPGWQHAAWAGLVFALVGLFAFGALTAWRASLDERERQGDIDSMRDAIDDRDEYIDELEAKVAELEVRLNNALMESQREHAAARAAMAETKEYVPAGGTASEPLPRQLYDDAVLLINLSTDGMKDHAKDKVCRTYGLTSTRWFAARDVLVACKVWRRLNGATDVLVKHRATALRTLAIYAGMPVSQSDD